jgi:hypothetical protein
MGVHADLVDLADYRRFDRNVRPDRIGGLY